MSLFRHLVQPTTPHFEGAAVKYVKITANSNWAGILDQYGLSEVLFSSIPIFATEPSPDSGATDVTVVPTLSWKSGREAVEHNVYISADEQDLIDGTATGTTLTENSYSASLDLDSTYYWQIEEVNNAETLTNWSGDIWSFSTQEFFVVDDFESFDEDSNLIYETWEDGYDNQSVNGSIIGYIRGDTLDDSTVYDGDQSAPLYYNNNTADYSEVTVNIADLQVGQDWTAHGVTTLVLYFYGDSSNVEQQMYVKVNGAKVLYDGDPLDITRPRWKQWTIDLAEFGEGLSDVTEISIGFDRIEREFSSITYLEGGQGMVYVDGIRLYKSAPATASEEVWLEAEEGLLGAGWRIFDDPAEMAPASSAGRHIGSKGDGSSTMPESVEWIATYTFDVVGGDYKVLLRGFKWWNDSFFVRIPTATSQNLEDPDQPGTGWVNFNSMSVPWLVWGWDDVHSNNHGNEAVIWTLSGGTHTLQIARREDGVLLDAIVITDLID